MAHGHPRAVDQAIARFDEVMGRIDRGGAYRAAAQRHVSRGALAIGRKVANIGMALGILIAATIVFFSMLRLGACNGAF